MWNCKHCKKEFDFETSSNKANHSRWCNENPKRNDTENLKKAQQLINDNKLGKMTTFTVKCKTCENDFEVQEREKLFPKKSDYFCNRNCANSMGGKAKAQKLEDSGKMNYRSLARRHHEKKCIVCDFDKIVEVHHINEIHTDNRPENLVFLCPNHHSMFHSRYKEEIVPYIKKYLHHLLN